MSRILMATMFSLVALVGYAFSNSQVAVERSASSFVAMYCRVTEVGRLRLRERIAKELAPNKLRVECATDAI